MAVYKIERRNKYPNIPYRYFNPKTMDWYNYKKWMEKEELRQKRMHHNRRISQEYKPEKPPEGV